MSNRVLLKKSSVSAKVPLSADLEYGEVALNYQDGKLYFKTAGNNIEHFDSRTIVAQKKQEYTATASQTTFTVTGGYVLTTVQVFANGIALAYADYTATNGTTVVVTDPRVVGDNIIIWFGAPASGGANGSFTQVDRKSYIATSGQTTFNVTYAGSYVDVYINGSHLNLSDYTATSGTNIVLNSGAAVNDEIDLVGYYGTVVSSSVINNGDVLIYNGTTKIWDSLAPSAITTASAAKWSTARTLSYTGDATGSMSVDGSTNVSAALTLATVNSNVGSFGSTTASPIITVNAKGLVTAVSTSTITPAIGSITGLGTNVATALGVNTGTAGAFVVNGDALGTPASGVVTNLTGTASININGTVGATTATTGAFTTLSMTGTAATNTTALSATGTTTGFNRGRIFNTGGDLRFGIDSSVGAEAVAGSAAYSSFIGSFTNTPFYLVSNSAIVGTVSSTGLDVTGTLDSTGDISTTSTGRLNVRGSATGINNDLQIDNSDTFVNFRGSRSNAITKGYIWYLNNSTTEGARLTSTGLAVTGTLSATTSVHARGFDVPASGVGAELGYSSPNVFLRGYDRTNSVYKTLTLNDNISIVGGSAGAVIIQGLTVGLGAGAVATNTAVGASALGGGSQSGGFNSAFGYNALIANTTGTRAVAIGYNALASNTTGDRNHALGLGSMTTNTTGNYNTAVGYGTLAVSNSDNNSALGYATLQATTSGTNNTGIGYNALYSNTTASGNTAVGYQAGYSNTTGASNTFVGQTAGYSTTGGGNTFVGATVGSVGAGYFVTTGTKNTIIGGYHGNQGGLDIRTASNYIVLSDGDGNPRAYWNGANATFNGALTLTGTLSGGTSGTGYSFSGSAPATSLTLDSSGNVGIGTASPANKLTLADNSASAMFYGTQSGAGDLFALANSASEKLRVTNAGTLSGGTSGTGYSFSGSAPATSLTLDSSGNLLVGTTSVSTITGEATAKAQVAGNFVVGNAVAATNLCMTLNGVVNKAGRIAFAESGAIKWLIGNGAASENGVFEVYSNTVGTGVQLGRSATAWSAASDERIKDIIEPIANAANKVATLRAVIGKYKTDESGTRRSFLIAQDVQAVLPEAVDDINPEKLGVRYTEVIPLLVAAIQEQQVLITALTARITALEIA